MTRISQRMGIAPLTNRLLLKWHRFWMRNTNPCAPADVLRPRLFAINALERSGHAD